jgi:LuxR family maltose regulon positive regulatory protein
MALNAPLLKTKLTIPPMRPDAVPRPRLIGRLDEGLRAGRKLTLVSAPPGFGKTTLVSQWVSAGGREVAWLSLDEGDNDPALFLTYLIAALQQIDPAVGRTALDLMQSPQAPPATGLVTPLINDLFEADAPLTLVLDDYQRVTTDGAHQVLAFLVEYQPPALHLVICTREDPPLNLPQLRARGQLTEILERDLRFTVEEAAAFLNRTVGISMPPEAISALGARTEGWIAGLQLAAIALLASDKDAASFVSAFTGSERYLIDYLVAEVFEHQTQPVRDFLRQTAILERLSAPLCDAVRFEDASAPRGTSRGAPRSAGAPPDSRSILDQLERANLFLVPLDSRRDWYRYHHLFVQFLRTLLELREEADLHSRAARWYEANGYTGQAIHHFLAQARLTGDYADAERMICGVAEATLHSGAVMTVRRWLDALPDERVRADVELATYKGWVLALIGDPRVAKEYADAAEAVLDREASPAEGPRTGRLLLLRAFIALGDRDYERVVELAAPAHSALVDDQPNWQLLALWATAEAQERTRVITEAIATLQEAARLGRAHPSQTFAAAIESFLANDLLLHGERRQALTVCEQAAARTTDDAGRPTPMAGFILSQKAWLHYEANELPLARDTAEAGLALCEQAGVASLVTYSRGILARVLNAQGDTAAALTALRHAAEGTPHDAIGDVSWLPAWEAAIYVQQNDITSAVRWARASGQSLDAKPEYLQMEGQLVYGRLLLAQGRLPDARRWLSRIERFCRQRGFNRWLITIHVLQALVADGSGDSPGARKLLGRAIQIGGPEDFYRAFLDEGPRVLALLPTVRSADPPFVDQLLAYFGASAMTATAPPPAAAQALIEPLSQREREVLGLVAAGLTNREIAAALVIALGTVKRHLNNIYGKLQVHSRTQALARARELGLL